MLSEILLNFYYDSLACLVIISEIKLDINSDMQTVNKPLARILLVDDDPGLLEELRDMLVYQKALVTKIEVVAMAENGLEALALVAEHQPDLVILDLEMPELDGIATAKALRRHAPDVRILIYSAHHDRIDLHAALDAGIRGYVLKSHSRSLLTAIDEIMHEELWFDPLVFHRMYAKTLYEGQTWMASLSPRERQVLTLMQQGLSKTAMAETLAIGPETIKSYLAHIRTKAGCANLTELKQKIAGLNPTQLSH
ncbi:MAG: hypothetical protein CVV27_08370 [Candidatus Melainabacteria bacterium HGW-Melainabacteria-1]|nr:MAG: hypothetical protein CVV27_08370 [Candidatus Melainabacteria bacterium HGW-Melainabacteria-1]